MWSRVASSLLFLSSAIQFTAAHSESSTSLFANLRMSLSVLPPGPPLCSDRTSFKHRKQEDGGVVHVVGEERGNGNLGGGDEVRRGMQTVDIKGPKEILSAGNKGKSNVVRKGGNCLLFLYYVEGSHLNPLSL